MWYKNLIKTKLGWLGLVSFLLGFQLSFTLYILSNYFQKVTGFERVEWVFILIYGLSLWALWKFPNFIDYWGRVKGLFVFLGGRALALLAASLFWDNYIGLLLIASAFIFQALLMAGFDLLVESYSKDAVTGKIRGRMLTLMNLGFLPAPFFAGFLVDRINFGVVFFLASLVVFVMAIIITFNFSKEHSTLSKKRTAKKVPTLSSIWRKIKKQPDVLRIYFLALLLQVFYAATVVYVPLVLLESGMSWEVIGMLLTAMLIPFVIVQYPTGIICDKKGEKEVLFFALLLMTISVMALGVIELSGFWLILLVLLIGRTGAALFEVARDSYFYKKVDTKDVDLISFFRSDQSLAYIIVAFIFGILSFFLEISTLFIVLAVFLSVGFIPLIKIKDTN
ncbi:MAG TPA: MFS transporter [Candidatus Moranbacteria bacterium]|nr:MFS transporter [Candidatus Moranbacteria bacterium]